MFCIDNSLNTKTPQDESPGYETEETPVLAVLQEEGTAINDPPEEASPSESAFDGGANAAPANSVTNKEATVPPPLPLYAEDSSLYEFLGEIDIDPGTYRVMQGRVKAKPNPKKIEEMELAHKRGTILPVPDVYEDKDTRERFSPDSAHRQAMFAKLGLLIRVRLFRVRNARERAELDSCKANIRNGMSSSRADREFQLRKACELHKTINGRYPRPSELASLTDASHPHCSAFLRGFLAPKESRENTVDVDEEEQRQVVAKLQKALSAMESIKVESKWIAGEGVRNMLINIAGEVRRLNIRQLREPDLNPEELAAFRRRNSLTQEKLAELLGVKHTTVSRWIQGKTKMTEHNQRVVRQLLSLTSEQLADIMEGNDADES